MKWLAQRMALLALGAALLVGVYAARLEMAKQAAGTMANTINQMATAQQKPAQKIKEPEKKDCSKKKQITPEGRVSITMECH